MFTRCLLALLILNVSINGHSACGLLCSCSVLTGGTINFSSFVPTGTGNTDVSGSFSVRCAALLGGAGLSADLSIALSQGSSGVYTNRTMLNGSVPINYNLYTTAARSVIWGNGTSGTGVVLATIPGLILSGTTMMIPVYGRVAGPQPAVTPGTYNDPLTITVTY